MAILSWRYLLTTTSLALGCFLTGIFSLEYTYGETLSPLVWPPAGIALAAILLAGPRILLGILLGHLGVTLYAGLGAFETLTILLGSLVSPLLGRWLLTHWDQFDHRLPRMGDVLALVLLGGGIPAIFNTALGISGFIAAGTLDLGSLQHWHWLLWWMGDTAGVMLLAPPLLLWRTEQLCPETPARTLEGALLLLLLGSVSALSFGHWLPYEESRHLPLAFLPYPCLIWIAIRLPMAWTSLALVILGMISLTGTALGYGPFVRDSATASMALGWSFLSIATLMGLLLAASSASQRRHRDDLRRIIQANPNVMLLADQDGAISMINRRCQDLLGYHPDELIGQPVERLLPTRFAARHARLRNAFINEADSRLMGKGMDLLALHKNRNEIPVEIGLSPIRTQYGEGVLAVISDIRERKQAEMELRRERNFNAAILDTAQALILVLDYSMRIIHFNKACEQVSGYQSADVVGRSFWDLQLIPEQDLAKVRAVAGALRSGQSTSYWENIWQHRNGEQRIISWSNSVLLNHNGTVKYLVSTGIDITEHKQAEEHLRRWKSQLVHQDRLATASEMASNLAHELNQPLTATISYAELALDLAQSLDPPQAELAGLIDKTQTQARRAATIVRHLRDFIHHGEDCHQWVDLNQLIQETIGFVATDSKKKEADIHLDLSPYLPSIPLVRVQIEQVLVNLLRNAFEAMEEANSTPRRVHLSSRLNHIAQVQLTVRDSGPGVPDRLKEQLFEAFESSKPQGLGMGLAISRSIIENHGGRIWLDPDQSQGAVFHITLPVEKDDQHDQIPS